MSDAAAARSDIPAKFVANVTARVRLWDETAPYYDASDGAYKPEESRGTEAVLNALILVYRDAPSRRLSDEAQAALEIMWRQQQQQGASAGAWPWLQFGLEPWEAPDSKYYGAALAALTVGLAPPEYRARDDIRTNVSLLRQYLEREYPRQSLSNRATLLWAAAKWPDLVERGRRDALVGELLNEQRRDGGWSLSSLARTWSGVGLRQYVRSWVRRDWTLVDRDSDGYATAFVTFVLVETGMRADEPHVRRALAWLVNNQNEKDGLVPSHSLNKRRDPASNIGRFMSDAATAYSLLALSEAASH